MKISAICKSVLLLTVLMVAAAAISAGQNPEPPASPEPLLKDVTGDELQKVIDSFEGEKAVLVNVWATWCAPCIEEFPYIVELQRAYEEELKVIFVSADFPDSRIAFGDIAMTVDLTSTEFPQKPGDDPRGNSHPGRK